MRNATQTAELTDVRFVGAKTASVLAEATIDATDIAEKRVAYTQLVEAGVNPGVAARIRRAHSLSWSFESSGADLERRSTQVRGLGEEERAWVAASSGEWTTEPRLSEKSADSGRLGTHRSAQPSQSTTVAESTRADIPKPTPLSVLDAIDASDAAHLGEAGICSVRRLATVDPTPVAAALDLHVQAIHSWREAARTHRE